MDRKYLMTALGYGIIGLLLGIHMAMSKNHGQYVTHAHIMLVGFVVSFIYAACYKVWLPDADGGMVKAQWYLHLLGSIILTVGFFLMYGHFVEEAVAGPVLGIGSIAVLIAMILMKVQVIKGGK